MVVIALRYAAALLSVPVGGLALGIGGLAVIGTFLPGMERRLPERRCQVAASIAFKHSRQGAALRWGCQLGTGVCTYIVVPALLGVPAAALIQELPAVGWLLCVLYGLARGCVIAGFAVAESRREARGIESPLRWPLKRLLRMPLGGLTAMIVAQGVIGM